MATMLPPATIGEFSPAEPSSWPVYLERLEFFFQAHDITSDDKKRALLCSVCGVDAYALLRSLCAPKAPSETPFKDIIAKLNGHFIGKPNVTMERFRFNKRDQLPGESVQDFLAALRQLARYCDFEDWLDRLLCDHLVCGLRDETIQRRLLAEPDLKLTKAILLARAAEEAAAKTEELRRAKANSVVDANQLQNSGKRHGAKGPASGVVLVSMTHELAHTVLLSATSATTRGISRKRVGRKQQKKSKLQNPVIERDTRKNRNIVDATTTFRSPVTQLRTSTLSLLLIRTRTSLLTERPSPPW